MENFEFIIDQKSICRTTPNPLCGSNMVQLTQKYLRTNFWSPGKSRKEVQKCPISRLWTPLKPHQGPQWPQHGMWVNWAWFGPTWATWVIESSRTMVWYPCPLLRLCVNSMNIRIFSWLSLFHWPTNDTNLSDTKTSNSLERGNVQLTILMMIKFFQTECL